MRSSTFTVSKSFHVLHVASGLSSSHVKPMDLKVSMRDWVGLSLSQIVEPRV